jgi:DNA-binding NtrC family response regulator
MVTEPAALLVHPRYEAGPVLGRGAQGIVLRVTDREDAGRALVAKLYRPGLLPETGLAAEFALLSRLRSRFVVRAHDLARNQRDAAPFLVEDLIDGPDAAAWLQHAPEQRAVRLTQLLGDVARGLLSLHEAGFLHGDLKPAHVRFAEERCVLLDLGAAIGGNREPHAWTAGYSAPELRAGAPADVRCDLYGLGALAWAAVTGEAPRELRGPLRSLAPWVPPRVADVIDALLAPHPRDRIESAVALLAQLGQAARGTGSLPNLIGRSTQLQAALRADAPRVRYLVGGSGSGKSHLAREIHAAALLSGRQARLLSARDAAPLLLADWASYLRGGREDPPAVLERPAGGLLLVLDDLDSGPCELRDALETYRIRHDAPALVRVIAATALAPLEAERIDLPPLGLRELSQLARAVGAPEDSRERLALGAAGNPGWLVGSVGRVPLDARAVLERAQAMPLSAARALAAIAAVGGSARAAWLSCCDPEQAQPAAASLLELGLVRRRREHDQVYYELEAAAAAAEIARVLADPALLVALADALLADEQASAAQLLALARIAPEAAQTVLLGAAASRARESQARDAEIDALFLLGTRPAARSYALLARLERLLRDAGQSQRHATVVSWLEAAADSDDRIRALSLRRSAEQLARSGAHAAGLERADAAISAAQALDPVFVAYALATKGAVHLYAADHTAAAELLLRAREQLLAFEAVEDREELARLDHNLGVVAVYRGELDEASRLFAAALAVKQRLGDRPGMRACLRNLGYALLRGKRYAAAIELIEQALALSRSLQQVSGQVWSLVALAEAELGLGNSAAAERRLAEADAIGEAPAAVRADAALLRAELALRAQDWLSAAAICASISPQLRAADAEVDTNAFLLASRLALARTPSDARSAARLALRGLRRARAAALKLAEQAATAQLVAALRERARQARPAHDAPDILLRLALAESQSALTEYAAHAAASLRAERVFALVFAGETLVHALAVDLDGLPLSQPERRADLAWAQRQLAQPASVQHANTEQGSRLAIACPPNASGRRLLLVAEQRFARDAFASVPARTLHDLSALGAIALRLDTAPALPAAQSTQLPLMAASMERTHERSEHATTALPVREPRRSFPAIFGRRRALRDALARLDRAIDSELPLLITGPTGVGKELFARAAHELGPRSDRPFVAINCGALPAQLFESELFGHERGAFTGAERKRPGLLRQAEGGVLLLDEIGDLALPQQVALLRALETRRARAVGSDDERAFDVRIIAATNRDLLRAVEERTFRQDLLYRLNVLEVRVPSLAERRDDIAELARHFLRVSGAATELSADAVAALEAYAWPGNVRELAHLMLRASALELPKLELAHLPRQLRVRSKDRARTRVEQNAAERATQLPADPRMEVLAALEQSAGNISQAARLLGLTRHGLKKRMLRLGLRNAAGGTDA